MNEYKKLRLLIIKRFLLIILFVSVAEYGILSVLRFAVLPVMMHYFFDDAQVQLVGIAGLFIVLILMIGIIVLEFINLIIPGEAGYVFSNAINGLNIRMTNVFTTDENIIPNMNRGQEILFFIILLASVIIIILPYVIGAFIFSHSVITEFRIIEEEDIKKQKEYEKKRNLMLSDIAHDLRTPITTVSGYAKALSDGMVSEDKQAEYLAAIQTKSKRMSDLISLLFDYVKLDSEGFQLSRSEVDICELVRECVAFQYQDIEDEGMTLDIDIPEKKLLINADKLQISRVITNLITNAIRHNEKGTDIGVFLLNDDELIRIMVADNGDMIEENMAEHLFEPFVMGDESRNTRGGSGLGLSIVKKIIDMHGFDIRLIQQPNIKKYALAENYKKMFMIVITL